MKMRQPEVPEVVLGTFVTVCLALTAWCLTSVVELKRLEGEDRVAIHAIQEAAAEAVKAVASKLPSEFPPQTYRQEINARFDKVDAKFDKIEARLDRNQQDVLQNRDVLLDIQKTVRKP